MSIALSVQREAGRWIVRKNGVVASSHTTREEAAQAGGASAFKAKVEGVAVTLMLEGPDGISRAVDLEAVVEAIGAAVIKARKAPK